MEVLIVSVLVYSVVSACVLSESGPKLGGHRTGRCGNCRYELIGLSPGSPCPECGSTKKEVKGGKSTVDPERRARWIPTFILFCMTVVFARPLAESVLVLSYLHDHFGVESALISMHTRELSDWSAGSGGVLFPLLGATAFSPLVALVRSRRAAAWWVAGLTGGGLLATLAYWTILQPGYS
jgi:hypothetical protein